MITLDNIHNYVKLLNIYKKTYKQRGMYNRSGCSRVFFDLYKHFNFNWEIRGLVPDSDLQTKKMFEL